jgi:ABC-2 type transport system permease protein
MSDQNTLATPEATTPAADHASAPAGSAAPAGAPPTDVTARLRSWFALFRRELSGYFQTPVAYVVGAIFLGITAALFFAVFFIFERAELRQFFGLLPMLLALLMPALAMRLVAEERRRGTWEILTTLPVGHTQIVLAKFAAVWVTGLFLLAPTLFFAVTVSTFGALDPGPVVGGYLGAVLLVAAYGAVGVFSSSVARNETVALVLGLVISLALAFLEGVVVLMPAELVSLVQFLGTGYHFSGFTRGVIDSRSVVYLLSVTAFFLVLARHHLDRQR